MLAVMFSDDSSVASAVEIQAEGARQDRKDKRKIELLESDLMKEKENGVELSNTVSNLTDAINARDEMQIEMENYFAETI